MARSITWAADDTDDTLLQIREHNCVGAHLCGWGITGCPAA